MQYIYNTATLYISEYSVVCKNTHLTYISVTGNYMESDTRVSDFMRLYDFNLLDQLIYASHPEERETKEEFDRYVKSRSRVLKDTLSEI